MLQIAASLFQQFAELTRGKGGHAIVERLADLLGVERASIWWRDEAAGQWQCRVVVDSGNGEHAQSSLSLEALAEYLAALDKGNPLVASSITEAPAFREWHREHLSPLGVVARMDCPVILDGKAVGALCAEHRGSSRLWSKDEIAIATFLANLIGLQHRRAKHRAELTEVENSLRNFQLFANAAPLAIGVASGPEEAFTYVNPRSTELFGYGPEEVPTTQDWWRLAYPDPAYRQAVRKEWEHEFKKACVEGRPMELIEMVVTCKDGSRKNIRWGGTLFGRQFISFGIDVTDRRQAEEALRNLNVTLEARVAERTAKLDAANRMKSEFLANMSHEIRTPMNAILGYAQLMQCDPALPREQRARVEPINRAGEHLLSLINDILEMSKIEAGHLTRRNSAFDLYALLDDLVEIYSERARAKGISIVVERAESLPRYIFSDESKVRQTLVNLLGNAVKFTKEGGVNLLASVVEEVDGKYLLRFTVADTGAGISEEEKRRLFQPFVQSSAGIKMGGTGLGLAISRQYARLLGGDITVESRLGEGSRFTFTTSASAADAARSASMSAMPSVLHLEPGCSARILVVDDVAINRDLLGDLLTPLGFETRMAVNGVEALEIFATWKPDAILMDMRMPGMDGYEANRCIRARRDGKSVLIIAITASGFEEELCEVLGSGADFFMRKPFKRDELLSMLGQHLKLRYVYAEAKPPAEEVKPPDFSGVSSGMRAEIRACCEEANCERLLEICDQVAAGGMKDAAAWMRERLDSFEYDSIARVLHLPPDS